MVDCLIGGEWRIPTSGEYLLRPGKCAPLRAISAVLHLAEPYFVHVSSHQAH